MRDCRNCRDKVHTPDERTGLIHVNGKYCCRASVAGKDKVAE